MCQRKRELTIQTGLLRGYGINFNVEGKLSNAWAPAACPAVQLNSDTVYPEVASDPTGEGISPTRPPQPITHQSKPRLLASCTSPRLAINQRFP